MISFSGSFINNEWSGATATAIDVTNPKDGSVAGTISDCGAAEAEAALAAAKKAFPGWAGLGIDGRAKHILAWKTALVANRYSMELTNRLMPPLQEVMN